MKDFSYLRAVGQYVFALEVIELISGSGNDVITFLCIIGINMRIVFQIGFMMMKKIF